MEVRDDPNIKDKKLLHFVNYIVASTDYESFYKIMGRAAKKARLAEMSAPDQAECKSDAGEAKFSEGSKGEGKRTSDMDSKYGHK